MKKQSNIFSNNVSESGFTHVIVLCFLVVFLISGAVGWLTYKRISDNNIPTTANSTNELPASIPSATQQPVAAATPAPTNTAQPKTTQPTPTQSQIPKPVVQNQTPLPTASTYVEGLARQIACPGPCREGWDGEILTNRILYVRDTTGKLLQTVTTDASGHYKIVLEPGNYIVYANSTYPQTSRASRWWAEITVNKGVNIKNLDFDAGYR